jgi:hypothetical protein
MIAVNVGCGTRHADIEGYEKTLNIDLRSDVKPDVIGDLFNIPKDRGDIGLIYSSHVLEHFNFHDGRNMLRYFHSVLKKPEGKLWVVVPNLEYAAIQIIRDGFPMGISMDILYGHQEYDTNFHKNGFTPWSLREFVGNLRLFKVTSVEERCEGFEISLKADVIA